VGAPVVLTVRPPVGEGAQRVADDRCSISIVALVTVFLLRWYANFGPR
jgi:hypothetical protein